MWKGKKTIFSFLSSGTNGFFSCEYYQRPFRALIILFIALQIIPLIIFDNSSFLGPFLQGFGWRATKAKVIMEERVVEEHIHLRTKRMILKWIFANDKLAKQQNCLMCDGKVHRRYVKHHRRSWPGATLCALIVHCSLIYFSNWLYFHWSFCFHYQFLQGCRICLCC